MRFIDLIKMGARNLLRRKARTLLTVIGVIIGTISIVVMISIGIGMNRSFEESIMENGSMTIIQVSASISTVTTCQNFRICLPTPSRWSEARRATRSGVTLTTTRLNRRPSVPRKLQSMWSVRSPILSRLWMP